MYDRTDEQELRFLAQMDIIHSAHVELFAYLAAVTIRRGHVYRHAQQIGMSLLEITTAFGRDLRHLDRVGDLADAYGRADTVELRHAAWLAITCHGMPMETIVASIESDETMLKTLGPTGRFARGLVEWRRLVAAGEPSPVESVARQLGHFLGQVIDEYNVDDIVRDLGGALGPGCAYETLLDVVADHRGALVTPDLCRGLTEAALGSLSS